MDKGKALVERFLKSTKWLTDSAAMREFVFEQYAISWLTGSDIELSVRALQGSGSVTLNLAKRELKVYKDVLEMVNMGEKPTSICGGRVIQTTQDLIS